jgi:hypothetical protein
MPSFVPGIHVFASTERKTWMAGTSPAMTTFRYLTPWLESHFNTPLPATAPVANEACSR